MRSSLDNLSLSHTSKSRFGAHLLTCKFLMIFIQGGFFSSVRSSNSHPNLLLTHHPTPPTFSDHTGPQHRTFTF